MKAIAKRSKICNHSDCTRMDAGGGFCISHGGGRRCGKQHCTKVVQRGGFCRSHGGGSKCKIEGCSKVDAGKGFCRAHGGGKRCRFLECKKADIGGGFCTAHGGGKRCLVDQCSKNDQGGGYCRAHGGGKRCAMQGCGKGAQNPSLFCVNHGGRVGCKYPFCSRISRRKSGYCSAHVSVAAIIEGSQQDGTNVVQLKKPDEVVYSVPNTSISSIETLKSNFQAFNELHNNTTENIPKQQLYQNLDPFQPNNQPLKLYCERVIHIPDMDVNDSYYFQLKPALESLQGMDVVTTYLDRKLFVACGKTETSLLLETIHELGVACSVVSDYSTQKSRKEIVLKVDGMMCMNNCGNAVKHCLQNLPQVEDVKIIFPKKLVIVQTNSMVQDIIQAIEYIGFQPKVLSIVQMTNMIWLKIFQDFSSLNVKETINRIIFSLPGIENVILQCEQQKVLVIGKLSSAAVIAAINDAGLYATMDDEFVTSGITLVTNDQNLSVGAKECSQKLLTTSHTAALAVGWIVPGCAMASGGECTCGDSCECEGCPEHAGKRQLLNT